MAGKPNDKMFKTMVEKHGGEEAAREWFRAIGHRGGLAKVPKGFALNPELARTSGAKAGRISKRNHKYIKSDDVYNYYVAQDTGNVVRYKHDNNSKEQTSADR